jgi:hypothetical protein
MRHEEVAAEEDPGQTERQPFFMVTEQHEEGRGRLLEEGCNSGLRDYASTGTVERQTHMDLGKPAEGDKADNLWQQVLLEASKKTRLLDEKTVLVLGKK